MKGDWRLLLSWALILLVCGLVGLVGLLIAILSGPGPHASLPFWRLAVRYAGGLVFAMASVVALIYLTEPPSRYR